MKNEIDIKKCRLQVDMLHIEFTNGDGYVFTLDEIVDSLLSRSTQEVLEKVTVRIGSDACPSCGGCDVQCAECLVSFSEAAKHKTFDVGDIVHHVPTREDWVVACVVDDRVYWVGYPYGGNADFFDCFLVKKASDTDRQRLLEELAKLTGSDVPTLQARKRLAKEKHV